ncbi:MAG: hypothetical protein AAGA69_06995, partial [Pseudomonadota bacterium]
MTLRNMLFGNSFYIPCTITVKHDDESLEAHVELDNGVLPQAGDRIRVEGSPVNVEYGESVVIRREAHVHRGSYFDKLWARLKAALLF